MLFKAGLTGKLTFEQTQDEEMTDSGLFGVLGIYGSPTLGLSLIFPCPPPSIPNSFLHQKQAQCLFQKKHSRRGNYVSYRETVLAISANWLISAKWTDVTPREANKIRCPLWLPPIPSDTWIQELIWESLGSCLTESKNESRGHRRVSKGIEVY